MVSQRFQNYLTELANTDTLTRIPNRNATNNFIEKEYARVLRKGGRFSILLIELDNFKQHNDKYGHAIGDQVLITTAKILASAVRKQDIAGRWGGEEFLMILPDTSIKEAENLAERLRKSIKMRTFKNAHPSLQLTISVGVASSDDRESIDDILKKADDALYVAKSTKNSVSVAI